MKQSGWTAPLLDGSARSIPTNETLGSVVLSNSYDVVEETRLYGDEDEEDEEYEDEDDEYDEDEDDDLDEDEIDDEQEEEDEDDFDEEEDDFGDDFEDNDF